MDDKISILYVDDEEDNLTTFKSVFRREYNIFLAKSGEEALSVLGEQHVDLIITDQRMPEMSGIDLLIKIVDDYPNVLRIILTGYSDVNDVIMAINSGKIHSYITKPWNKEDLKSSIDKVLAKNGKLGS